MDHRIKLLHSLFKELIVNRWKYFDDEYVNSDGRKLLEDIFRIVVEVNPSLRRRIYRVRRDPSFSNIVKIGVELIGFEIYSWVEEDGGIVNDF